MHAPDHHAPDYEPVLRTLGGLALTGSGLTRPKPLLVLAYLALEGRQSRRHLAELFFSDAAHPLQSLSVALSRARRAIGERLISDERTVEVGLRVDAADVLAALEEGDLGRAAALYRGPFLEGVTVDGVGVEVEEWTYATREFVADQLREARLRRGESEAAAGRFLEAGHWAEAAWGTAGTTEPEGGLVVRLHDVLLAADHPVLAARLASAAREWGVEVADDRDAARGRLQVTAAAQAPALPPGATGFVGRERERVDVRGALLGTDGRLVTLVGPGGVGKTQLALRVAHELDGAGSFPDGVHFVGLGDVLDAGRVASRVAHVLDVALSGDEPPEARLARALRERRALVVLDNAEHVQESVAALVSEAKVAAGVRWLVTSRERLDLRDETPIAVGGLGLPSEKARSPAELLASDAVSLFVQRARRVRGPMEDEGLWDVTRICHAVGGWPLALEIAASLTRVMSLGELADELEQRLDLLVEPGRDVPARHHSILGVLDATWQRLTEADRDALVRLSVFRGGFARADADAAVGIGVARLARLVDRALLRQTTPGRFDLHPLVWRYARDRLAAHAEGSAVVKAHARHFLGLLEGHADALGGGDRDAVTARLVQDHANLRDAWLAALETGDQEAWGRAALGFGRYLDAASRYREGVEWLAVARERTRGHALDPDVEAVLALCEATMLARLARFDAAAAAIEPAVAARDPRIRAAAHETLAHGIEMWRGRYAAAGRHLREAEALHAELGDPAGMARSTFVLANLAWIAGDWDEAQHLLREARESFRGLADLPGEVITTAGLGVVEMDRGDLASARLLLERARGRAAGLVSEHLRMTVAVNLARVRLLQGDLEGLEVEFADGMAVFERVGDDPWVAETAGYAARLAALSGRRADAVAYLRTGLEAALRLGQAPSVADVIVAAGTFVAEDAPADAVTLLELVRDHPLTYANTRQESVRALAALGGAAADPAGSAAAGSAPQQSGRPAPPATGSREARGSDPLFAAAEALLHDGVLPSGRALELVPPAAAD